MDFDQLQQMPDGELHALAINRDLAAALEAKIAEPTFENIRDYRQLRSRFTPQQQQQIETLTATLVPEETSEASPANKVRESRSNMSDAILDHVHTRAVKEGLITEELHQKLNAAIMEAEAYHGQKTGDDKAARFTRMVGEMKGLSAEEKLGLSRLMAVDAVVINAVRNYENASQRQNPAERFKVMLSRGLKQAGDDEAKQKEYLASVKETLDLMLISMVYTMHPTIFHTVEATHAERDMTEALEGLLGMQHKLYSTKGKMDWRGLAVNEVLPEQSPVKRTFEDKAAELIDLVKRGKYLTPFHKVTVAQETEVEKEFHARISRQLQDVVEAWNSATGDMAEQRPALADNLQALRVSDERVKSMVEFRTWGRAADADGREKATSIELGRALRSALNGGTGAYEGPALDMRQNSEVHRDFFSALVQKAFNISKYGEDKKFSKFCSQFMRDRNHAGYVNGQLYDPERSIYQDLTLEHQREFVAEMIAGGIDLIKPELREKVRQSARDFNEHYYPAWDEFVRRNTVLISESGFDPNTVNFLELGKCYVSEFKTLQDQFREELESKHGISLNDTGLGYQRAGVYGEERDFLKSRVKPDGYGRGGYKRIDPDERVTLMDAFKRMLVINDAIDKHGSKVADRYQIANFEQAADFYVVLKLFQESGLVTIGNGRVTNVKMGIQPLLETEQDMLAAPKIFRELLRDPLIESYYLKRGKVDLMLGFSDGAKSAGNFASQWRIRQTAAELTQLFEDHFSQPQFAGQTAPRVRILQGRGRGVDRGGTIDPALEASLFPDNVNRLGYSDVTVQSDLPHQMGISDNFGRDYLTSKFMGVLLGRQAALQHENDPEYQVRSGGDEQALEWIARRSSEHFNQIVRSSPDVLKYLDVVPENKERSSREPKRGDETAKNAYDARRAISIEYGFNSTDLPAHQVGLRKALEEFSAMSADQLKQAGISTGGGKSGQEVLKELHKHPFFRAIVETSAVGMQNYDPNIARMYGGFADTKNFVDNCCEQLDGLAPRLEEFRRPASFAGGLEAVSSLRIDHIVNAGKQSLEGALDLIAHAVLGTFGLTEGDSKQRNAALNPKPQQDHVKAEIVKNLVFASTREIAWRPPTPSLQQAAGIAA